MIADRGRPRRAPIHFFDLVLHREHAVNRRFKAAGDLGLDHLDRMPIAAKNAVGGGFLFDRHDVAKLDIGAARRGPAGGERRRQDALAHRLRTLWQLDVDLDRLGAVAALRITDLYAADESGDRVVHRLLLNPIKFEVFLVDRKAQPRARLVKGVVDINNKIDLAKGLTHFHCRVAARRFIGSVYLSEQGCQDRRPGRYFDNSHNRARWFRQIDEAIADVASDRVARPRPIILGQ